MSSNYMTILNNIKAFADYILIGNEMISEKEKIILKRFGQHLKSLKEKQKISYRKFHKRIGLIQEIFFQFRGIVIKVEASPCLTFMRVSGRFTRRVKILDITV